MKRPYPPTLLASLCIAAASLAYALPGYVYTGMHAQGPAPEAPSAAQEPSTPQEEANLAYYVGAHQLDPIFALEGTDPGRLRAALKSFFGERDAIAKLYPPAQEQTIRASLYPATFLPLLPELEQARQALLAAPSVAQAKKYHELLLWAAGAYAADARTLGKSLMSTGIKIPSLGYLGGTAATDDIATKLMDAASAALAQKKKEEKRFACLENLAPDCPALASLAQARAKAVGAGGRVLPAPGEGIYKAAALSAQMLPLTPNFVRESQTILAVPSTCMPGGVAYMRDYYNEQVPGQAGRKHNVLNDVYFYDFPRQMQTRPQTPIYKKMSEAGIELEYQSMGNLYMCPDAGLDGTEAARITGVLHAIAAKHSLTPGEQELLALPLAQKSDLVPYVAAAAQAGTPEGDRIVGRYLQGSADWDQMIMGAYKDNRFLITWDKEQHPVAYEYMVTVRNFASTLFLLGNPTFMPKKISLFSDRAPNPPERLYLRGYLNDASKHYTDEEILSQYKNYVAILIRSGLH